MFPAQSFWLEDGSLVWQHVTVISHIFVWFCLVTVNDMYILKAQGSVCRACHP